MNRETYLPTQQAMPQIGPRFPCTHENCQRPQNREQPPPPRSQTIDQSVNHRFPKALRLLSRRDYQRMGKQHTRLSGTYLLIDYRENQTPVSRLGITVTRQFGDSHKRNRFKRLVREAFRLCYPSLRKGLDINIRPRNGSDKATLQMIQQELLHLLC